MIKMKGRRTTGQSLTEADVMLGPGRTPPAKVAAE